MIGYDGNDRTDHDDSVALLCRQTGVLERIAAGDPLGEVAVTLELLVPGCRCSILLLDPVTATLSHGAAPSLPAGYSDGIDGLVIGGEAGSCGAAAYLGVPVVAVDVTTDPRWGAFCYLAGRYELRSCWSTRTTGRAGIVGTFAVYHDRPHEPSEREKRLVDHLTLEQCRRPPHGSHQRLEYLPEDHQEREDEQVFEVYRHGIVHGSIISFDNIIVATKAWSMLFAVADWATATQNVAEPPTPNPTWRDTWSALKRHAAFKKYQDKFTPSELGATDPDFDSDDVVLRAGEFPDAWKQARWGLIVPSVPPKSLVLESPRSVRRLSSLRLRRLLGPGGERSEPARPRSVLGRRSTRRAGGG